MDKKNRFIKITLNLYKNLTLLINHTDFLFKNKFINQEFYIEIMKLLNDIQINIITFEDYANSKRVHKKNIDISLKELNNLFEKICIKIGCDSCDSILDIFIPDEISIEYKNLFKLYNQYFIPLSCNHITEQEKIDKFIKRYNIKNISPLNIIKLIDYTKSNTLIERIDGATIVFIIDKLKIIYINGYFKKDSLNIFKFKIDENSEYLNVPNDFKEKYIEQISLRDFLILTPLELSTLIKDDYEHLVNYKNKSLSLLIKDFIKSNIEKQRKIIILFLLSDKESQFTAHIIFDLIADKSFLSESQYLCDLLYNSLHWKLQKLFKVSQETFMNSKKKLENISINDVPYDSRILAMKADEYIKAKAMEKLKEINGSKENSIKAQHWLDGFLKIPFNIFKNEPIINFFKSYQTKIDKYIDIFTLKISEFEFDKLNDKNRIIYDIIIQVIDEYHSNIYKSENTYTLFIKYMEMVKESINNNIGIRIQDLSADDYDIEDGINIDTLSVESINDCISQLNNVKKIKHELYESQNINQNNIKLMVTKLSELESIINCPVCPVPKSVDDTREESYNISFNNYILKNLEEFDNIIEEWETFKIDKHKYINKVDIILDKCTYGQTDAKNQMKRIIGQWMNGVSKGQCFGLCGPPGVGKTTLCKNGFAKCLFDDNGESRPFAFLPLGGATNGSILEGHHYTYLGSTWGKIIDILMETKCMNPIIYIDELDKISKTEHGKEIISILTHITDQSQNKEFYDRYFANIPIDLSQVLFIFSYNDKENIDRILRDRIQEINIKPLSNKEKLVICQNYTCPEILNNIGFSNSEIIFNNEILTKIINEYTYEAGVRKLNEILYDIIRDINLKKITGTYLEYPIIINDKLIDDILSNITKMSIKKIGDTPKIGLVNGLYATSAGLGGITIIQVMKTICDKKLSLEKLTGNQGDVMKESMSCALTLAWNIIPESRKQELNESKDGFGLHIHCPESATPKDGPSAGLAITTAIISRIMNIPIKNDLAMTGEVDLMGKACEIGGLYSKLQGALNAGIKVVLIPKDNEKDLDIIFKTEEKEKREIKKSTSIKKIDSLMLLDNNCYKVDSNKRIFRDTLEIYLINNIFDVLKYALIDNNVSFQNEF